MQDDSCAFKKNLTILQSLLFPVEKFLSGFCCYIELHCHKMTKNVVLG